MGMTHGPNDTTRRTYPPHPPTKLLQSRQCASRDAPHRVSAERGISPAQVTQRIAELERALTEIDPGHPLLVTRGYPAPHRV